MKPINIPVKTLGPGSQPTDEDGAELNYMQMPSAMYTYTPSVLPEIEETAELLQARGLLKQIQEAVAVFQADHPARVFDLSQLDEANRQLLDQVLGEGEVSIVFTGTVQQACIQESVFAGIWRVQYLDNYGKLQKDLIEIATIPDLARFAALAGEANELVITEEALADGVLNAPSILVELKDKTDNYQPGDDTHVINLSLLPQTPEDLAYLEQRLGRGPVTILSRGYGNCRITSTSIKYLWWVQYYNSTDTLILNSLEVVDVPMVACASQEDIDDSAVRMQEILETFL